MFFSIIIPVFNRPDEVDELLSSLSEQKFSRFEVIIVEDGSELSCQSIVELYRSRLKIKYFFKENSGPGQSRNYGALRASGDYFIFLDSDCIVPVDYLFIVNNFLENSFFDAFGGPDAAHFSFTNIQKAINYAMTSPLLTGGIRGGRHTNKKKFHPRSFNMGFSRQVFEATGGFAAMRFGEDIDMSIRILKAGFNSILINEAFVYHKRRTDLKKFFKQVHNSGIARINLFKKYPESLKAVHFLPSLFVIGCLIIGVLSLLLLNPLPLLSIILFCIIVFLHSLVGYKNSLSVSFQSILASFVQLWGYGTGFIKAFWKRLILQQPDFQAYQKTFYK